MVDPYSLMLLLVVLQVLLWSIQDQMETLLAGGGSAGATGKVEKAPELAGVDGVDGYGKVLIPIPIPVPRPHPQHPSSHFSEDHPSGAQRHRRGHCVQAWQP